MEEWREKSETENTMEGGRINVANVRNLCVIAHVDHGKSTLSDTLVRRDGLSNKERALDHARPDQAERNITIKSTGASLKIDELFINLIDSPGHVDFSPEVSSALRMTDGALVVVDAASGVKVQTVTVLKQSLAEAVTPVLVLNKIDRLFLELQLTSEEVYLRLSGIIDHVNSILEQYRPEGAPATVLSPMKGNVIFASGKQGWGFTLPQLAGYYAAKMGKPVEMFSILWGENFQDSESKKWSKRTSTGRVRGFCKYVMDPLLNGYKALHKGDWKSFKEGVIDAFGLTVKEVAGEGTKYTGSVFAATLPLAVPLVATIRTCLPSPIEAQKYRASLLYTGPKDAVYEGIENCDPEGTLCVYVAKLTPGENNTFWAFGRVLSGSCRRNQKVHLVGPTFDPGLGKQQPDVHTANIQSVATPRGADVQTVDACRAGELVLLGGIDKFINRTGTIVSAEVPLDHVHPIKSMKFTVSAIVARSVKCKNAKDVATFQKALQKLGKTDNLIKITYDPASSETVIAGAGELHLEIVLSDLRRLAKGVEIVVSDPVVALRESCKAASAAPALAKSSNKLNRVFATSAPLHEGLVEAVEHSTIPTEPKERAAFLNAHPEYEVDGKNPKRLWAMGGEAGPNVLCDETSSVSYLNESQGFFVSAFNKWSSNGPICGEPVQGVRINVKDVKLHSDRVHRGAGELLEACRRAYSGALLTSEPRLLEPVLMATIEVPTSMVSSIYNVLASRRGKVVEETPNAALPISVLGAHVPALESFAMDAALRAATAGGAFLSLEFSHWQEIDSDPLEEGSFANRLMKEKRKLHNLPAKLDLSNFIDKL